MWRTLIDARTLLSCAVLAAAPGVAGCGEGAIATLTSSTTEGEVTGGSESAMTTTAVTTTSSADDGDTLGVDAGGPDETGDDHDGSDTHPRGFIDGDDASWLPCDVWAQDCPPGEKCAAWGSAIGWDAVKCVPLDPNPVGVGDPCWYEGVYSGIDSCELGSMCWGVNPDTGVGTCVAQCSGTPESPICLDPGATCSISNSGSLILCLPTCDPLAQGCAQGEGCYAFGHTFVCAPYAGVDGGYGDPCEYLNTCPPGLFCADAADVPGCQGAFGCCSEFCTLSHPDGDQQCNGAADGQKCLPWFDHGQAPPGADDIGGCLLPN
jgi:hypothetical protein